MMNGTKDMSESQKKEMRRRSFLFLHYLIRSPFYDNFSRYLQFLDKAFSIIYLLNTFVFSPINLSSIITLLLCQFEQRIPGMKYLTSK